MKEIEWKDIRMVCRYESKPFYIDFEVFQIVSTDDTGKNYFEKKYNEIEETTNLDEAQHILECSIKWDSCCHFNFGDDDGYIHLCGKKDLVNLIEAMKRVYAIAASELVKENNKEMFE